MAFAAISFLSKERSEDRIITVKGRSAVRQRIGPPPDLCRFKAFNQSSNMH